MKQVVIIIVIFICCCILLSLSAAGAGFFFTQKKPTEPTQSTESTESTESIKSKLLSTVVPTTAAPTTTAPTVTRKPVAVGKSVKCTSNIPTGRSGDTVYRWDGNKLRSYPSEEIANSWDSTYYQGGVLNIDCVGFTVGDNMAKNPLTIGKSVKCTSNIPTGSSADTVYRWDGNKLRSYPSEEIANSWDSTYYQGGVLNIDCAGFTVGDNMAKNQQANYRYLCNEHDKCLTDSSGYAIQYSINTNFGDKQKWKFDGKHICNPNNKCLAAAENRKEWGGQYRLWDKKDDEKGQQWTLRSDKHVCNEWSGDGGVDRCMGSANNSQLEGADLIQWGFVDEKGQKWSWKDS